MRKNRNRWVPQKQAETFLSWLLQNVDRVAGAGGFSSDISAQQFHSTLAALIAQSDLDAIATFIESNVDYESWRLVKLAYARQKHRDKSRLTKIDVSSQTLEKLRILKEIHGLSSFGAVVAELVDGSISSHGQQNEGPDVS